VVKIRRPGFSAGKFEAKKVENLRSLEKAKKP
jgi:hypothetical protein